MTKEYTFSAPLAAPEVASPNTLVAALAIDPNTSLLAIGAAVGAAIGTGSPSTTVACNRSKETAAKRANIVLIV